ncbi:putative cytochrome b-c1 complex subunit 7 [Helianthus annuus]|nr:putative cytochrome b-c1 complex subunit 7 [Helianthus annuus]
MATSKFVKAILDPKTNWFAAVHKKTIESRLRKYGLRYDDLYDPMESLDIKEALNRLPREIVDARNQRLLRAMDLSMKHEYLSQDLQVIDVGCKDTIAQQTPFRSYLSDMLALVTSEDIETGPVEKLLSLVKVAWICCMLSFLTHSIIRPSVLERVLGVFLPNHAPIRPPGAFLNQKLHSA